MTSKLGKHLNPATVMSAIALFVALGGVSYAAATIHGKNIKNGTITAKKLKNKTITAAKIKRDTLTGAQVDESRLGKVPAAAQADSATQAQTAASASSIADGTVTSPKVADGTLTGHDVGRRAGSTTLSVGSIPAQSCVERLMQIDPTGADMRDDAFAMTAEDTWPTGLTFNTENSNSPGYVRVNVCNVTTNQINANDQLMHWVAFDV